MLIKIIKKPIVAVVLSLILVFLGLLGLGKLPVLRFPEIAPPSVQVNVSYPGASAKTVAESVLMPIEEEINGVDNMTYVSSRSSNSGDGIINIFFKTGTDPNQAAVNVQTRVSKASDQIPEAVVKQGISVTPRLRGNIMTINVYSARKDSAYNETFLQAYAILNVKRAIRRVSGVATISTVGRRNYSMRVWFNPDKLATYSLTPQDVMQSIKDQNFEIAPGKFGESSDEVFETPLLHNGRFSLPEEYENLAIKTNPDGSVLFLKDVARVELGATNYGANNSYNGQPGMTLNLTQTANSNAREIDIGVRETLEEISQSFPPGIKYDITYSVRDQIDISIDQVKHTLLEAFILVFLITFLFLQDFRATLIAAIAIPLSLVGTFFFIYLLGFSINVLTLFALVLAIGIVVDNAIVVVEAIYEKMYSTGMKAKQATIETMGEIKQVIISITVVMSAVFIPVGFMEGSSGIFYEQFAYTLAIAIVLSAFNALTLTPALCALFIKQKRNEDEEEVDTVPKIENRLNVLIRKVKTPIYRFFNLFNAVFDRFMAWYTKTIEFLINKWKYALGILVISIGAGVLLMEFTPKAFIPTEDDSFLTVSMALQPGASLDRTQKTLDKANKILKKRQEIMGLTSISGFNASNNFPSSSFAVAYINLKPIEERGEISDINKLITDLQNDLSQIDEAVFQVYPRPTIQGFGDFSGVKIMLQDKMGGSYHEFDTVAQSFIKKLNKEPSIFKAYTAFNASFPQYTLDINYLKAKKLGVNVKEMMKTIQAYYGRVQTGDFSRFGRQYRVYVKADKEYRADPSTFSNIFVKNNDGDIVPVNTLIKLKPSQGPETVNRFNLFNAIKLKISPAEGSSSGEVLKSVERLSKDLPANFDYELTGMTKDEEESKGQTSIVFTISFLFVYLLLAIQYNSFIHPLGILITVPTSFIGIYGLINLVGINNNIYVQVGIIMLIGLLAKNAILVVEYALMKRKEGWSIIESAKKGAELRVRPILMTSFAFIAGLIPLMFTIGPSAKGNHSISYSAAGGMLAGVFITIVIIPAIFVFCQTIDEKLKRKFNNEK